TGWSRQAPAFKAQSIHPFPCILTIYRILRFLLPRTITAAAIAITAALPAIGNMLSPVFTALLPEAAVLLPFDPPFWLPPEFAFTVPACTLPAVFLSELPV